MKSSRILEAPINAEMEQEFKPFFIEDKTPDLDSGVEESNKPVLPYEKKDRPILSIYIEQLKGIPLFPLRHWINAGNRSVFRRRLFPMKLSSTKKTCPRQPDS